MFLNTIQEIIRMFLNTNHSGEYQVFLYTNHTGEYQDVLKY